MWSIVGLTHGSVLGPAACPSGSGAFPLVLVPGVAGFPAGRAHAGEPDLSTLLTRAREGGGARW